MTAPKLPEKWNKTSSMIYKPRPEAKFYVVCAPLPSGKCSITMVCFDETLKIYPWLEPPDDTRRSWISAHWKKKYLSGQIESHEDIELAMRLEHLFQMEIPALMECGIDIQTLRSATINPRVSWLDMSLCREPEQTRKIVGGNGRQLMRDSSFVMGEARYSTPGGGIALVGDSCHACTASLGQGCNLALESAVALGDAIDDIYMKSPDKGISIDELSEAFSNYGSTRPKTARSIQAASSSASKFSLKW